MSSSALSNDPIYTIAQIVALQCCYYITVGVFQWALLGIGYGEVALHHFFQPEALRSSTTVGWLIAASYTLASASSALAMMFIVERATRCLDFAATMLVVHLVIVSCYAGFLPRNAMWWICNSANLALVAVLSEFLCIRRESRESQIGSLIK